MKKEKPAKKKEFSASPFRALKGVKVGGEERPAPPSAPKQPAAVRREEREDADLFWREMEGVTRLEEPAKPGKSEGASAPPPARARGEEIRAEESKAFLEALRDIEVRFHDEIPEESPEQQASVQRMRRLKRGDIRVDLELDLHGLTREEALESLSRFIASAWKRGQKVVLVITGKGNNSTGEPVLQRAVAAWLREQGKKVVAEFAPAPRAMGGSGAFVVFLRERKVPAERETGE